MPHEGVGGIFAIRGHIPHEEDIFPMVGIYCPWGVYAPEGGYMPHGWDIFPIRGDIFRIRGERLPIG